MSTSGFVIRRIPFRETSELIYWFTPTHGIVHTLAKGIHRARSPFRGCFDLLDRCDVGYSTSRREEGLALVVSVVPTWRGRGLRADSGRLRAAYIATDVVRHFVQLDQDATDLFDLYDATLHILDGSDRAGFVLAWFRMRSLSMLGHRPELRRCLECDSPSPTGVRVDLVGGGVVCGRCRGSRRGLARFSRSTLELLTELGDADDPGELLESTAPLPPPFRREVRRFLRDYTAHLLDRRLVTES